MFWKGLAVFQLKLWNENMRSCIHFKSSYIIILSKKNLQKKKIVWTSYFRVHTCKPGISKIGNGFIQSMVRFVLEKWVVCREEKWTCLIENIIFCTSVGERTWKKLRQGMVGFFYKYNLLNEKQAYMAPGQNWVVSPISPPLLLPLCKCCMF